MSTYRYQQFYLTLTGQYARLSFLYAPLHLYRAHHESPVYNFVHHSNHVNIVYLHINRPITSSSYKTVRV